MRQVVLDTETTGLEPERGHRVVEVGAVEVVDRRFGKRYHCYIRPDREVDDAAFEVHGLSDEFLADKPQFGEIAAELIRFIEGAELIIHNAPFDVSFLDYELSLLPDGHPKRIADICTVTDSMVMARHKHPGQKNGLDALCRRYDVDNSGRDLHGALLDAELLADVFLAMTGGQGSLFASDEPAEDVADIVRLPLDRPKVPVLRATPEELAAHEAYLDMLDEKSEQGAVWRRLATA